MVGDENILVNFDCQNIILVDPNKTVNDNGEVSERQVKHENLVFYANLECNLYPRTRLAVGANGNYNNETISIAKVNFLKPGDKKYLTNEFYDTITGLDYVQNKSGNFYSPNSQNSLVDNQNNTGKYAEQASINNIDSELLGITQIEIKTTLSFMPEVTIQMEDVRGRALFEKGENSPYSVFFNQPYPLFHLTVKGYYGQAIKHQLALRTFSARFDTSSGNFKITVKFYAYKYNILTMLPMKTVLNAPYMYRKRYEITPTNTSGTQSALNQTNGTNKETKTVISSKGYEKLYEVYSDYKSKELIPDDFPILTLQELSIRLENLETYIVNTFSQADLTPLTDGANFRQSLNLFEQEVVIFADSWINKYLDKNNYYIYKGNKIYTFKKEIVESGNVDVAKKELRGIINKYNEILSTNKTFGKDGQFVLNNKEVNSAIYQKIVVNDLRPTLLEKDYRDSFIARTGRNPNLFESEYNNFITTAKITIPFETWYGFEGEGSFEKQVQILGNRLDEKLQLIQKELTAILSSRLRNKEGGLGFSPTIRNVLAVILANTEAFVRLMCDVHELAWDKREAKERLDAVIGNESTVLSSDAKDRVQKTGTQLNPVYPWPQYFRETNDEKGEKYELTYPGDPTVISKTKGYLYDIWPEIEFVEEFLKADVFTKENGSLGEITPFDNEQQVINRISLNALDYPTKNIIFANKQESKYLYEIWERTFLSSYYQNFNKPQALNKLADLIAEAEFLNVQKSLGTSSNYLIQKLKNYGFNSDNYEGVLYTVSNNGVGESWQKYIRGEFVTPYIEQEVQNSFSIYDNETLSITNNEVQPKPLLTPKLVSYLQTQESNSYSFTDVYPYNSRNWFLDNLADSKTTNGEQILNTSKTLVLNENKKMIANFAPSTTTNEVRPITNFNYRLNLLDPTPTQNNLKAFYDGRTNANMYPSEGRINYGIISGTSDLLESTSILNTPYFVNAIQDGVNKWLTNDKNPYKALAYLLLNSLPVATLREKYKTYDYQPPLAAGTTIDLDYIFATYKKFGAIHKIPYAFILKYGSIWHRYKTFVDSGVDILQGVWNNFSANTNFDPITNNLSKEYTLTINGVQQKISAQKTTTVGLDTYTDINVGFYPKLINDFSIFFKGSDLFTTYSDSEIQSQLNDTTNGFTLTFGNGSSYTSRAGYNPSDPNNILRFKTWTTTLKDSTNKKDYILPSFGTNINQTLLECFDNGVLKNPIVNNTAVTNGAVRTFWSLPNYGYFDNSKLIIPPPDKYFKEILTGESQQQSFIISNTNSYTSIEDVFSIYEKEALDIMEREFLNFSKSQYDFEVEGIETSSSGTTITRVIVDTLTPDNDSIFQNVHLLVKELLSVTPTKYTTSENFINEIKSKQLNNFNSVIQRFLEYDVVVKNGNPSFFNRRVFESYRANRNIIDGISYQPYIPNSLPTIGGTTTLAQSIAAHPQTWKNLQTYVGFSNINGLRYTDNGSFITDFFVDMNIEFNEKSVIELAPLIKIYATQKLKNNALTRTQFESLIEDYLNTQQQFSNLVLNFLFQRIQFGLPNVTETTITEQSSAMQGEQLKLDLWEKFKSINDSWIAGYDYKQTTFLEDVLIMDRANRNIGDIILIDPFKTRNLLNKLNEGSSVYSYVTSVLSIHNFITLMSPAYVNYYNVQEVVKDSVPKIDSTTDFANNLFGTFLSVDTRKSSPKLVCVYVPKPSQYPNMEKNQTFRFKNDAFNFGCGGDNPLFDKLDGKKDWGLSNRVVGFNVDVGIRNQNIFNRINVAQDLGKQTSEAMEQTTLLIDQSSGKKVATQNVSLWNVYNARSYECEVEAMGNAMIQPTMYFNLKYVPMFNGPYHINEVSHVISPGAFRTTFKGIRQQVFALPKIENYIQGITNQIFNDFVKTTAQSVSTNPQSTTTTTTFNPATIQNTFKIDTNPSNCQSSISSKLNRFVQTNNTEQKVNVVDMVNKIKSLINTGTYLANTRVLTFVTVYLASYTGTMFSTWNSNYCGARLDVNWRGLLPNYFKQEFSCQLGNNGKSYPFAVFENLDKMILFMNEFWKPISGTITALTPENIFEKWKSNFNVSPSLRPNELSDYINSNQGEYQYYLREIKKALELAKTNSLY